jgi:TolB protein
MKMLRLIAVITAILAGAGCLGLPAGTTEPIPESGTPRRSTTLSPEGSGTLAYVGADGNVWMTSPGQGWTEQVTGDATGPPEGQGRSYHRVAWGPDGSLAFAAVVRSRDHTRSELFLRQARDQPAQLVAQNDAHFVIYLYGSPAPCSEQSSCPLLAYLIQEENGVGLHMVMTEDTDIQDLLVAVGRPFYLSWSPDGQKILWHTGGALRDNPAAEIGLYHIGEDRRSTLPYAPGTFLAPAWSPQDENWLSVVASDGVDRLQHIAPDEVTTLATTTGQGVAFVWSPDGGHVAYAARKLDGTSSYGPVRVIDLETGKTRQLTSDALSVLGFFWSPDGRRLAYLTRLDLPNAVWMQWRVFDLAEDRDRGFAAFHPSPLMTFIIHSFNQYAQSHRFWSPDGRYLVYADHDDQSGDRIWLVDTKAEKEADPILIDGGSIGIWSWR